LSPPDEAEVCDYLPLVFLVAELLKKHERLLEVLNRDRDAAVMNERESEVVQRQRFGPPVTDLTRDRKRGTMLLGCLFVIALTSELRSDLVEPTRSTVPIGSGWFAVANLQERTGPAGSGARGALDVLLKLEVAELRLEPPGSPLGRQRRCSQPFSYPVAAQEPQPSRKGNSQKRREEDDPEAESRQHSGQQEPEPGEREHAPA
jgi:hypothetical protein